MPKKRILIFSLVYFPNFIGGAEIAIKEITDRLGGEAGDFEFDMITLRLDKNLPKVEKIGNVTVHRVGFAGSQKASSDSLSWYLHLNKYFLLWTGFRKASKLHKKNKYDAIWSMMATYNSFAAILFKIFNRKVKFLLTLQEGDPIPFIKRRARPLWPLFKMIFTKADQIQTISNYLADFAKEMGGRYVTVVPNGVDVRHFSGVVSPSELEKWKEKIGKTPEKKVIVTASRLVVKNAVADIVKSLTLLPENILLAIAGTGYEEKNLKKIIEVNNLSSRVTFLGHVPHGDLPKLLKASDVFVRPSLSEGFGNSFIEAMASHIPVVATPVGGIVDFLYDGETGLFCEVENPKSIAEKVKILLENKNVREPIIENAFKMVSEKYDWNNVAEGMREIFYGL